MKFESYESDRQKWVNSLAQEWLRLEICLDLTVVCGAGDDERKSFQCHKIILLSFLKQYCPIECLVDVEEVILPDTDPKVFEEYLKIEYGFVNDGLPEASLPPAFPGVSDPLKEEVEEDDCDEEDIGNLDDEYDYIEEDIGDSDCKFDNKVDDVKSIRFTKEENHPLASAIVPLQCRICYKVYNARHSYSYKLHFSKMHPNELYYKPTTHRMIDQLEKYPCRECGIIFGSLEKQSDHLIREHYLKKEEGSEKILQNENNEKYIPVDFEKKVDKYVQSDSERENFHLCGKSVSKSKSVHHIKLVHGEVNCACGVKFSHEFEFYDHKYSFATDEKKTHQIVSDDTSKNTGKDNKEEEIKRSYSPCTRCHEAFQNSFLLRRHMLDNHWEELKEKDLIYLHKDKYRVKDIFCDYEGCESYFRDIRDKRDHVNKIHLKAKVLQCDQCLKTFYTKSALCSHKETKHVVDPKICQECGLTLPNRRSLMDHINRFHKKEDKAKFLCQYCDFSSINNCVVKDHERTHTGERPNVCKFCGKGFTTKRTMLNHERLHTGAKPYACRYCDSKFVQRTSVNVHVKTHHKTEVANAGPKEKHYVFQQTENN